MSTTSLILVTIIFAILSPMTVIVNHKGYVVKLNVTRVISLFAAVILSFADVRLLYCQPQVAVSSVMEHEASGTSDVTSSMFFQRHGRDL